MTDSFFNWPMALAVLVVVAGFKLLSRIPWYWWAGGLLLVSMISELGWSLALVIAQLFF